jgi:outer membrane protein OmpA-like peptidoglycan-associated protein
VLRDYPDIQIRIEGHTDNVGNDATNLELSKQRADAVFEYIISKGIDARRLITEGFGETRPIDTNTTTTGKARNRRVEFHILQEGGD